MNKKQKACTHPEWVAVPGEVATYRCAACDVYGRKMAVRDHTRSNHVNAAHGDAIVPWKRKFRPVATESDVGARHHPDHKVYFAWASDNPKPPSRPHRKSQHE